MEHKQKTLNNGHTFLPIHIPHSPTVKWNGLIYRNLTLFPEGYLRDLASSCVTKIVRLLTIFWETPESENRTEMSLY